MLVSSSRPAILLLIFYALHSFVGLTYEVVWIKYLTATLGMTLPAFAVVLATFMAGLGIGSFTLSCVIKRATPSYLKNIKSSLMVFAFIQAAIGMLGMIFPFVLDNLDSLYIMMAPETEGIHHLLVRCAFTAILLLPITSLLGTGFPLLAGLSATLVSKNPEQRPGRVYYVGVLASAIGALAALVMIPTWGLLTTSLFLGAMNLMMASSAYMMGVRYSPDGFSPPTYSPARTVHKRTSSRISGKPSGLVTYPMHILLSIGAMTGFLILGLEIVGAQFVWLIINATAYSEGILFAAILLAMAMGSALYLVARPLFSPITLLILGLAAAVCAQMALIPLAGSIASLFDQFLHQAGWGQEWIGTSSIRFFVASGSLTFSVLGLPALGYGLAFCCLCELSTGTTTSPDTSISESISDGASSIRVSPIARLYAWHNWGSVVGVLLTSFVLIPWLGLTLSLTFLSVLGLAAILIMFTMQPLLSSSHNRSSQQVSGIQTQTILIGIILLGGVIFVGANGDLTYQKRAAGESQDILFQREEASGVVEVFADQRTGERTLHTSRLRQEGGSGKEDLRVQRLQGYLPVLLHPDPQQVLAIGLGTGIAAASYLRDEVKHVTIVEISEGIIEAAAFFEEENFHILEHPKTRMVKQDGRNFMKLSRQRFDLIVQELFFPYQSGIGSLYTIEHYQRCRERLAPGGMVGQWITINQLGLEDLRVLVHTFQSVFPHTSLWLHGGYLLILGGLNPLSVDFSKYSHRFYQDDPLGGIANLGTDPYDFLGRFLTQGTLLENWVSDAPINTDDNRFIEYSAPLSFTTLNTTTLAATTLDALLPTLRPMTDVIRNQHGSSEDHRSRLMHVSQASSLLLQGIIARTRGHEDRAEALYMQAWQHNPANYQTQTFLGPLWASRGRAFLLKDKTSEAERWLNKSLMIKTTNPDVFFDLGLLYSRQGHDREATIWYKQVLEKFPDWPQQLTALFNLGLSQYRLTNYAEAVSLFQEVIQREPGYPDAHFNLANSFVKTGDYQQAATHYTTVLRLAPDHRDAKNNLAEVITWLKANGISGPS